MKANFALSLFFEGIGLRHRGPKGWQDLGRVPLDAPDLDDRLRGLRDAAASLAPSGVRSKVVLPDDQILYRHLPDVADAAPAVAAALEGLTPYAVAELVFDWQRHPDGGVVVAAVARETLDEAEVFARQHGFGPVAFTADPDKDKPFAGAPDFGPASAPAEAAPEAATTGASGSDSQDGGDPVSETAPDSASDKAPATASNAAPGPQAESPETVEADTDDGSGSADKPSDGPREAGTAPETSAAPAFSTRRPAGDGADGPALTPGAAPGEAPGTFVLTQVSRRLGSIEVRGLPEGEATASPEDRTAHEATTTPKDAQEPVASPSPAGASRGPDTAAKADAEAKPSEALPQQAGSSEPAAPSEIDKAESDAPTEPGPAAAGTDKPFPIAVAVKTKSPAPPKQPTALKKPSGQGARRLPNGVRNGPPVRARKDPPPARPNAASASVGGASRQMLGAGVSRIAATSISAKAAGAGFVPREPGVVGTAGVARILPVSPVIIGLVVALALALVAAVGLSRVVLGWLEPPGDLPAISADAPMVAVLPPIETDLPPSAVDTAEQAAVAESEPAPETAAPETLTQIPVDAPTVVAAPAVTPAEVPAGGIDPVDDGLATAVVPATEADQTAGDTATAAEAVLSPDAAGEPAGPANGADRVGTDATRDSTLFARSDPGIGLSLPERPSRPAQTDTAPVAPSEFVQGPGPAPVDLPEPPAAAGAIPDAARFLLASLDAQLRATDPFMLAPPVASETGREPQPAQPLPPPGTVFALDARGLVAATPDGALSPDGHLVTLGRPDVLPPPRPLVALPAPALAEDPAEVRRLAAIRPLERPTPPPSLPAADSAPDTSEAAPTPQSDPAVDDAIAEALAAPETTAAAPVDPAPAGPVLPGLRPPPRPATAPATDPATADDATAPRLDGATRLAVATSARPSARPQGFDAVVAAAMVRVAPIAAAPPAATTQATPARAPADSDLDYDDGEPEVAATTRAPQIPSSANVARQATISNAINLRQINLIGVYGTASDRRALIRLSNGRFVKVQVGDRVDGGQVAAIGEREVRYVKGGQNHVLSMPRG